VTEPDPEILHLSTAEQHNALGHPLRLRLLIALGQREATISQLAIELDTRKGNVAHHLKVLADAGLVRPTSSRQVRGGTEQYYARAARRFEAVGEASRVTTTTALQVAADEIAAAPGDPFLLLRHLRLSADQAAGLIGQLAELANALPEAPSGEPRHTVLLGVYQRAD
jgi:DNA-binding transcriptional ArsR family regulator